MEEIKKQLQQQQKKIDEIYKSVNLIKKIFIFIVVFQIITFLLPLLGLAFIIPRFLNMYLGGFM